MNFILLLPNGFRAFNQLLPLILLLLLLLFDDDDDWDDIDIKLR